MRKRFLMLACLALTLPPHGVGAAELGADLGGLLAYAHEHNPELRQRTLEARAAHAGAGAASALPDPSVQVELMDFTNAGTGGPATLLPGEVGTSRYLISQPLPFYGKRALRGKIAEGKAAQSDAERDAAGLKIESGIKSAYARYYQAAERSRILVDTLTLYRAMEKLVLVRYGVGLVPQQDAIQAQSEITATQIAQVDAARKRREAAAALNALLDRPVDAPLASPSALPKAPARLTLEALRDAALGHSPDLARDRAAIDTARDAQTLTLRDRYPDFELGVRNTRPRDGVASWDVMMTMTVPFQQSARRSREAEAGYRLEAAEAARESTRARILGRLGEAFAGYEGSRDQAALLRGTLLPQVRATLKAARAGYETGQVDFTTLIQAERQILKTRLDLLDAETESAIRLSDLEQLTGTPL